MTTILDLPKDLVRHLVFNYLKGDEVKGIGFNTFPHKKGTYYTDDQLSMVKVCKTFYNAFTEEEKFEMRWRSNIGKYVEDKLYEKYQSMYCFCREHILRIPENQCKKCKRKYNPYKYYLCEGCGVLVNRRNQNSHLIVCPKLLKKCYYCSVPYSYAGLTSYVDRKLPAHSEDLCSLNPNREYNIEKRKKHNIKTSYFNSITNACSPVIGAFIGIGFFIGLPSFIGYRIFRFIFK